MKKKAAKVKRNPDGTVNSGFSPYVKQEDGTWKIGRPRPKSLPHVPQSQTSKEAARSMERKAPSIRDRVFSYIKAQGRDGSTDDELEQALGLRHQTASARRRELVKMGLVQDSGQRRPTRSGRSATVWASADLGVLGSPIEPSTMS